MQASGQLLCGIILNKIMSVSIITQTNVASFGQCDSRMPARQRYYYRSSHFLNKSVEFEVTTDFPTLQRPSLCHVVMEPISFVWYNVHIFFHWHIVSNVFLYRSQFVVVCCVCVCSLTNCPFVLLVDGNLIFSRTQAKRSER